MDCSSSTNGIANLRKKYQSLVDANVGLDATNFFLESEDEILAKAPHFTREQVKVIFHPVSNLREAYENRN